MSEEMNGSPKSEVTDLDALAAARREKKGKAPVIRFKGQNFKLPLELPFTVIEDLESDKGITPTGVIRAVFGDQFDKFRELNPTVDDVNALFDVVSEKYALSMGNSPASSTS